ncbi:MAG: hypothetical protein QOG98_2903 [Pseudonocardiales bacterium]|nr:hypothetical protein [Pseudonocardiales bacterium]
MAMRPDQLASGLLEAAPDAIVGVSADGVIVIVNAQAERLFGYPRNELLGERLEMLVPESAREIHPHHRLGYVADPSPRPMGGGMELSGRRRDGTDFPAEISLSAIETGEGIVISAAVRDVTDRKRAEEKFRGVLEAATDAIVGVNAHGVIVLVNAQAERLFGYPRDELLDQRLETLVPESAQLRQQDYRDGYVADEKPQPMGAGMELSGRRRDGTDFPAEISMSAIQTEDGIVVAAAIRDVSERSRAEEKLRGVLEAATDAIVGVNAAGVIVLVNAQAERLFGYPRDELLDQRLETLVPESALLRQQDYRDGYVAGERPQPMGAGMELAGRRRDGTDFPAEISMSAIQTEEGIVVAAAIRDVSERKNIEQQLREKNAELEKVARAKDTFLASMSHELRTPLNAILGFTGTLLMQLPGPLNVEQMRQLRTVEHSGKHLLAIINDLLDLAKIESGAVELVLERVDCTDVVESVTSSLRPLAIDKGLEFKVSLPDRFVFVQSDTRALGQILINLVSNAIKFTDAGYVHVSLDVGPNGDAPTIAVSDSGPGIAADQMDRIFNAFERAGVVAARGKEGTGLGLYISHKLAELVGAEVTVDTSFGVGSTFSVVLSSAP